MQRCNDVILPLFLLSFTLYTSPYVPLPTLVSNSKSSVGFLREISAAGLIIMTAEQSINNKRPEVLSAFEENPILTTNNNLQNSVISSNIILHFYAIN